MKYTKEERLDIGYQIYDGKFTIYTASEQFGVNVGCARNYMRLYRNTNHLSTKTAANRFLITFESIIYILP